MDLLTDVIILLYYGEGCDTPATPLATILRTPSHMRVPHKEISIQANLYHCSVLSGSKFLYRLFKHSNRNVINSCLLKTGYVVTIEN